MFCSNVLVKFQLLLQLVIFQTQQENFSLEGTECPMLPPTKITLLDQVCAFGVFKDKFGMENSIAY